MTDRESAYAWMADVLARFRYPHAAAPTKACYAYLAKVSGLSRR